MIYYKYLKHLGFILCFFISIYGQDTHYWNNQYGTRAELLGGVVVGSIKDLSATYYNPGAVPLTKDYSLILTTEALNYTIIDANELITENLGVSSDDFGKAPSIFAVRLRLGWLDRYHLCFSNITKHDFKLKTSAHYVEQYKPDKQSYIASEIALQGELHESWYGLSFGYAVNKTTGIGISQFVAYRSQKKRLHAIGQTYFPDEASGDALIPVKEYRYYNFRTFSKLGISFDYTPFTCGIAMTIPSISILGYGSLFYNDGRYTQNGSLTSSYQNDLPAKYKSPLSISTGLSYGRRATLIHLTVEWFKEQKKYTIMHPEKFYSQSTGDELSRTITNQGTAVINYGIGLEHKLRDNIALYCAFTTDYSTFSENSDGNIATSTWDIYHITAGSAFTFLKLDLTLGLGYSFGNQMTNPFGDILDPSLVSREVDIKYRRYKFILGFSFL
jgi:hypothetical protein